MDDTQSPLSLTDCFEIVKPDTQIYEMTYNEQQRLIESWRALSEMMWAIDIK
jgi:hypothetical protein